jgi:hypothetical protein
MNGAIPPSPLSSLRSAKSKNRDNFTFTDSDCVDLARSGLSVLHRLHFSN